jgi:hypothetical protein
MVKIFTVSFLFYFLKVLILFFIDKLKGLSRDTDIGSAITTLGFNLNLKVLPSYCSLLFNLLPNVSPGFPILSGKSFKLFWPLASL